MGPGSQDPLMTKVTSRDIRNTYNKAQEHLNALMYWLIRDKSIFESIKLNNQVQPTII